MADVVSLSPQVGVVLFCFTGHASLPELYHHMRPAERCHFDRAVNVGRASGLGFGLLDPTLTPTPTLTLTLNLTPLTHSHLQPNPN